jgi:energy-coupling factor transport system substrate-specific component
LEHSKRHSRAKSVALISISTALLAGGKWAIAAIPNVEIVTSFLVIFSLYFGLKKSLAICFIWIAIEVLIWGAGFWVPLYFIYWPLLVLLSWAVSKIKWWLTIPLAIFLTAFFAPLSVTTDILMTGGIASGVFWQLWAARWISGIWFFLIHFISNAIIVPVLVTGTRKPMLHLTKHHCG